MTKDEAYNNLEGLRTWHLWKVIYIVTTVLIAVFMLSIASDVATVTRYNKEFDLL